MADAKHKPVCRLPSGPITALPPSCNGTTNSGTGTSESCDLNKSDSSYFSDLDLSPFFTSNTTNGNASYYTSSNGPLQYHRASICSGSAGSGSYDGASPTCGAGKVAVTMQSSVPITVDCSVHVDKSHEVNQINHTVVRAMHSLGSPSIRLEAGISRSPVPCSSVQTSHLRTVIIDGSNVAWTYGNQTRYECAGIVQSALWFLGRGHSDIRIYIPESFRRPQSGSKNGRLSPEVLDIEKLQQLDKLRQVSVNWAPSHRLLCGKRVSRYDDAVLLRSAANLDAVVVSNDQFEEQTELTLRSVVEERLLMYSFDQDGNFFPMDNPLGKYGPTLDQVLLSGSVLTPLTGRPCPYGRKCTYGNKCKYSHPERRMPLRQGVADKLWQRANEAKMRERHKILTPTHSADFAQQYSMIIQDMDHMGLKQSMPPQPHNSPTWGGLAPPSMYHCAVTKHTSTPLQWSSVASGAIPRPNAVVGSRSSNDLLHHQQQQQQLGDPPPGLDNVWGQPGNSLHVPITKTRSWDCNKFSTDPAALLCTSGVQDTARHMSEIFGDAVVQQVLFENPGLNDRRKLCTLIVEAAAGSSPSVSPRSQPLQTSD